jgi:hypothetical protein
LVRGLRQAMPRRRAEREAAHVAAVVRGVMRRRARAAAAARAGARDPRRINPPVWVVPEHVVALVSLASPALAARVETWRRARFGAPHAEADAWFRDAWGITPAERAPRPAAEHDAEWAAAEARWREACALARAAASWHRAGRRTWRRD